jgi:hypothetical protein
MLGRMEAATDLRCSGAGRPLALGIGLAAMLMIGAAPSLAEDVPLRQITIDATVTVGALRPLSGIQAAAGLDGTALYRAARIDESSNFALVDQSQQIGPSIHLQAALPPPGVELIVITENLGA